MKYIGALAVVLAAILLSREYARYMRKRLLECESFSSFISHMRIRVGCFLSPPSELAVGFSSPALEACGFISALEDGGDIYAAYKRAEPSLSLSADERLVLTELFSSLGSGYLNDGVRLIEEAQSRMESHTRRLREECAKNIKLVSVLSVTAAVGFLILVM